MTTATKGNHDMTDHGCNGAHLRTRTVGGIATDEGASVDVDHVYLMDADEAAKPDDGMVGLFVKDEQETAVSVLLTPAEALTIANRLTRAAGLVMESDEDLPDPEREYRRHATSGDQ